MVKGNFEFIDVCLKLLLDSESFGLGFVFTFKGCLEGVHSTCMVFASIIKLLNLFSNLPINLLADLSKLKRSPEDLVLFLFKSSLSLFKSSLEIFLFNFKAAPLFVKLMDGTATITKLVKEILDFIS